MELKVKQQMEPKHFSLEHIKNEVLTINSEHPSSEDNFGSKFQDKIFHIIKVLNNQKED